jgi:predicted dehydrogenase
MYGSRPGWYFEPGKHGGTWNDIAIHAMDYIPWATGLRFVTVNAARGWNAFAEAAPHFQDAAQAMLTMDNGCGVLGDVSYFAPDSMGYSMPWYWRMTFWGRKGVAEACSTSKKVMLGLQGEKEVQLLDPPAGSPDGYLNAFLADVAGRPDPEALNTEVVLRATRQTLLAQRAADQGLREVAV